MGELCRSDPNISGQIDRVRAGEVIGRLAAAQHGVVGRRQLLAAGVTSSMIETRIGSGLLVPRLRGVYAVGHDRLRREGHWLAAVLAVGPGAALSHRSAAALHGLRPAGGVRVDVSTSGRPRGQTGIAIHHTTVLEVEKRDGVPVTPVARTLVDLAGVVPRDQLAKALREAERQQVLDVRAIEAALGRVRNRPGPGHAAMRAALEDMRAKGTQLTRSALEDRFLALLDAHGLPRPLVNTWIESLEVDAAWPAARLVVELDGWAHHGDRAAFQRDRDRANLLLEAGWRIARFTHDDVVRRPAEIAARLARLLAP